VRIKVPQQIHTARGRERHCPPARAGRCGATPMAASSPSQSRVAGQTRRALGGTPSAQEPLPLLPPRARAALPPLLPRAGAPAGAAEKAVPGEEEPVEGRHFRGMQKDDDGEARAMEAGAPAARCAPG
jgi:hypothetical protein